MRKSHLSASEIEAEELEEYNRKRTRKRGYSMMSVRDRGYSILNNGVKIVWPVAGEWSEEQGGIQTKSGTGVPTGHFKLDGKLYDADDFRRFLRWV